MPPFFFLIGFSSVGSHPPVSERSEIPLMSSRLSKYQKLEICPRLPTRTVCRNTGARVGQLLQHHKFTFCAAFHTDRVQEHGCPCETSVFLSKTNCPAIF